MKVSLRLTRASSAASADALALVREFDAKAGPMHVDIAAEHYSLDLSSDDAEDLRAKVADFNATHGLDDRIVFEIAQPAVVSSDNGDIVDLAWL